MLFWISKTSKKVSFGKPKYVEARVAKAKSLKAQFVMLNMSNINLLKLSYPSARPQTEVL